MPSALRIVSSTKGYEAVVAAVRHFRECTVAIDGPESQWTTIRLQFATGTLVVTSKVQREPGDSFSHLVLSMHNYFRTVETDAEANKEFVLRRIENVEMMLGVVGEPEFTDVDTRLDCVWRIAEDLDAVIFNGHAMLNLNGERVMSKTGEYDLIVSGE